MAEDGLHLCRGRDGDVPGFAHLGPCKGDPQWHRYRRQGDPVMEDREREYRRQREAHRPGNPVRGKARGSTVATPKKRAAQDAGPATDWAKRAADVAASLTPAGRRELAAELGLPEAVLSTMQIGFVQRGPHKDKAHGPCYTFPELDADGNVVGITCRYGDGDKLSWWGGKHGLFVPNGWREREGPVYLPEGASDALALTALGLPAVGRPSNMAGVDALGDLLNGLPTDRPIVVLGEWDPKPNGDWPGLKGAHWTSKCLTEILGRRVPWSFPPREAKDVRVWCRGHNLPPDDADAWSVAGEEFAAALKLNDPPKEATEPEAEREPEPVRFGWIDSRTFAETAYPREWLVQRLLLAGQPAIVGGPKKGLKTTLLVDLALSLGTATPFLGHFDVYRKARVGIMSGESGEATLQETALRVCAAKGVRLEDADVCWGFRLPRLADPVHLAALRDAIVSSGIEVLAIDPLYLSLLSGAGSDGPQASNIYQMGPLLLAVAQTCLDAGCTPVLAHHYRLTRANPHDPPGLEDLAFAGIQEFARQWILLGRRERYEEGSGEHKLWLSVGGSGGQSGLWTLDVSEGQIGEDLTGRRWDVTVTPAGEARRAEGERRAAQRQEDAAQRDRDAELAVMKVIDEAAAKGEPPTFTFLRSQLSGVSATRARDAVNRLLHQRLIEETLGTKTTGNGTASKVKVLRRPVDDSG